MVGCVLSQLKPSELYIPSCKKGLGLRPRPFSQLRMLEFLGFYPIPNTCVAPLLNELFEEIVVE